MRRYCPMCVPFILASLALDGLAQTPVLDRHGDPLPTLALARLGTVRYRARGSVGFLADGRTVVSGGNEGKVVAYWDALTGKLLRQVSTGELSVRAFAVAPDGKSFAVCGFLPFRDGEGTPGATGIWNASSGKQVRHLVRADREADRPTMAFSADGRLLASMGNSGVLRIEEVATGVELLAQQFPGDVNPHLAFSADSMMLAVSTGANSRKLYVWKWQAGEEPRALPVRDRVGTALTFSPDGKVLAECADAEPEIRIWDVAAGKLTHKLRSPGDSHWHASAVFTKDGETLISSSGRNAAGTVDFWETATWKHQKQLDVRDGLALSGDGRLLAGSGGGGLWVWDLAAGKSLSDIDEAHQSSVERIVCAGNIVATMGETIRLWDLSGKHLHRLIHEGHDCALSPDGTRLVSSGYDEGVCFWDTATGKKIYKLPGHGRLGWPGKVGFAGDGRSFFSWGNDLFVRKWDVATGKALLEYAIRPRGITVPDEDVGKRDPLTMPYFLARAAFSRDGKWFVVSGNKEFHLFDMATGTEIGQIPNEGGAVVSLVISPDSRWMAASASGKRVLTRLPDGRTRSSSAKNQLISLWDLKTRERRQQIVLPDEYAGPVAFAPDGELLAAAIGGVAPRICLFTTATGKEAGALQGFDGNVRSLAFSSDGQKLITGMQDTSVLIWRVASAMK